MADTGIRTGKVSSVNYQTGMLKVVYTDKGKAVTAEMPYANYNDEYNMPKIGSSVLVAHLTNGSSRGVVIGTMWNKKNAPPESGKELYRKDLSKTPGAAMVRYSDASGEYLVKVPEAHIIGVREAMLGAPKTSVEASRSIHMESPSMIRDISYIILRGGEQEQIELECDADIIFQMLEKELKGKIKKVLMEITETAEISAAEKLSLKSEQDVELEDSVYKTTLSEVLERLEALDGNTSARK